VPLALTSNEAALAIFAGIFIVFALVSSLVIPRRNPDFPGPGGRNWFILATVLLFVAMLFAVEVFAKEDEPEGERAAEVGTTGETETSETQPGGGEPQPAETTAGASQGDPAAGKQVFASNGCGSCHTFAAAGAAGKVGPNLDEGLQGKDAAFVRESIVEPNAEVAEGFPPGVMPPNYGDQLSPKQLADLVAFLTPK
jgi:mono/diheme cytochrome c family protein